MKTRVSRGLAWVGLASSMVGVLDIVAYLIILGTGWVSQAEFGTAYLAVSLFPVLDLATDMGITAAVIQRDDHTEEKLQTVFWLNFIMSGVVFLLIALIIGPVLSWVQGSAIVGLLLTVYGTKLIWQNVYYMPTALMRRELRFKELSVIRIVANLAEFAGKVGGAYFGLGVWCFVLGPLLRVVVTGIGVQLRHPWRPKLIFKFRQALDWFVFGIKTSASQILFHIYTNLDYQVVGFYFGKEANGAYSLAYLIVLEPAKVIGEVVTQIAFPTFSKLKHAKDRVFDQLIAFTRLNMVVVLAFLSVVFIASKDLLLAFSPEYASADKILMVLCVVGALRALSFVVPPLLDGLGRPTLTLKYMIVATIVLPVCFIVGAEVQGDVTKSITDGLAWQLNFGSPIANFGALSVAIAWCVGYPVAFAVLLYMAFALLDVTWWAYIKRVIGIPLCAAVAMTAGWLAHRATAGVPPWAGLAITAAVTLPILFVLLAYFQGISPRKIARELKGDAAAGSPDSTSAES